MIVFIPHRIREVPAQADAAAVATLLFHSTTIGDLDHLGHRVPVRDRGRVAADPWRREAEIRREPAVAGRDADRTLGAGQPGPSGVSENVEEDR